MVADTSAFIRWVAVAIIGIGVAAPFAAKAGPLPPTVRNIAIDPDTSQRIILRAPHRGFLITEDGGEHWTFLCEPAFGVLSSERIGLAYTSEGSLLAASLDGLKRRAFDGCGVHAADAKLEDRVTRGLTRHPHDASTFFATTAEGAQLNGLYRSDDDGESWQRLGEPIEGFLVDLAIAPSNPERIYMVHVVSTPLRESGAADAGVNDGGADGSAPMPSDVEYTREYSLRVSDDGGATWSDSPLLTSGPDEDASFRLLHLDPEDADRVLGVRASSGSTHPRGLPEGADRIMLSEDGGRSWQEVAQLDDLGGFAAASDGQTLWIGNIQGGLWRSTNRGASFRRVHPELGPRDRLNVHALAYAHGKLWVAGHYLRDGIGLGVSEDGGETVRLVTNFMDMTSLADCDGLAETCEHAWNTWQRDVLEGAAGMPRSLGEPPVWPMGTDPSTRDAGSTDTNAGSRETDAGPAGSHLDASSAMSDSGVSSPESDASGCAVAGASSPTRALAWVLIAFAGLVIWRRRHFRRVDPRRL